MYIAKPLVAGSLLTNAVATYYTTPSGTYTRITQASLCNTDSTTRTVSIYVVASGGSATAQYERIKSKTLAVNETWVPYQILGKMLAPGDTIQAVCDAGSVVSFDVSGIELT